MEEKHIVQFSGGAASAYVAYLVAKEFGRENTILLRHDTKAECKDTYRFMDAVSNYIGVPITEASDGRSLWEVIEDNNCLPSSFIPFCTRLLKQEPAERFLKSLDCGYTLYNGLGAEEWGRVQRATARAESMGRKLRCLLYESQVSNDKVKRIIRDEWRICLPDAYRYLSHNNCIPCFKAGQGHYQKVWQHYPAEFERAMLLEEKLGHTVFKGVSLAELAKRWQAGAGQESLFDNDYGVPCMCAEF